MRARADVAPDADCIQTKKTTNGTATVRIRHAIGPVKGILAGPQSNP